MTVPTNSETNKTPFLDLLNHRKKSRKVRFSLVILLWTTIIVFGISPFSRIESGQLRGAYFFDKQTIFDLGQLQGDQLFLVTDFDDAKLAIENHPFVNEITFQKSLFQLAIIIDEIQVIGQFCNDCETQTTPETRTYLLSNGQTLPYAGELVASDFLHLLLATYQMPLWSIDLIGKTNLLNQFSQIPYAVRNQIVSIVDADNTLSTDEDITLLINDDRIEQGPFELTLEIVNLEIFYSSTNYETLIRYIIEDSMDVTKGLICAKNLENTNINCVVKE